MMPTRGARPRHAIILAAGMGARLRAIVDDRPKGLIEIRGETLVGRSVRLLRAAGIQHITLVAGYLGDQYERFAAAAADIHVVRNEAFETTGSMASLAAALETVFEPVLVLESDIAYEPRALTALLDGRAADATLVSGPTGAGDEVWVHAPGGVLRAMSKTAADLPDIAGEFVGITRLSRAAAGALRAAFRRFAERHGHGRMNYETDALVDITKHHAIAATIVDDLCWGEIDDDRQLDRVMHRVWPSLAASDPI